MVICVDFDGTCVTHEFPFIGEDIGAVPVLRALVKKGHQLILHTMRGRSNPPHGDVLSPAVQWFKANQINLYAVNGNPQQFLWADSQKVFGHLYIDDCALGAPLKQDLSLSEKPFIDWQRVEQWLKLNNIL